jgi:hypothetical protein
MAIPNNLPAFRYPSSEFFQRRWEEEARMKSSYRKALAACAGIAVLSALSMAASAEESATPTVNEQVAGTRSLVAAPNAQELLSSGNSDAARAPFQEDGNFRGQTPVTDAMGNPVKLAPGTKPGSPESN